MVFSDLFFLFAFIPTFAFFYIFAGWLDRRMQHQKHQLKNCILIIFSLFFYAWGEPIYIGLMLLCVLLNYLFGLLIDKVNHARGFSLALGVLANVGLLCTFKYLGFFADTLAHLGIVVDVPRLALPIGISFYIFQSITYLVDVYRRESHAQTSYLGLLLYISMFPQLISKPDRALQHRGRRDTSPPR